MDERVISDDKIIHFNVGKNDNEESSIIYRDNGSLHTIVLNQCAENYHTLNAQSSHRCVAERNILDFSITFFTAGVPTKIIFDKKAYTNFRGNRLLSGTRERRFHKLIALINDCGFTTYDLS